ncbi:hypothetical protein EDL79_01760 [Ehrlichia ruminantium]|uniref:Uncharacterized protein n=1 Tax=Ehrlichia ruminantium TaxID=779 RepID=A0AAE6Q8U9_EHRRU|nr:hypothetical protein [Ehrlichia ruminantium]QGR02398.1 hypothetical protein EDL81_01765 [Ehrlichia ruminantium]QGR03317.1 hypothetical protein EDL80_01760 [Ehrlichia ruminantium]QGR04243.1 hypothetical protein EDL79_01760 [Ehrlichia ruminantium]
MLGTSQKQDTSSDTLTDSQVHLTEAHLRTYIRNLIDTLYLYHLLDTGNAISLCVIGMLGLHSDFETFKREVEDTLAQYKKLACSFHKQCSILNRGTSLGQEKYSYALSPLFDKRTSDSMWLDIKELHTVYHKHIIKVSVNEQNNIISDIANAPNTKTCFVKISYTNPLRYHARYIILETLIQYHNTQHIPESTGSKFIDQQQQSALASLKNRAENKFHRSLKNKVFSSYAQYLKGLLAIITSDSIMYQPSAQYENTYIFSHTKVMVISKITYHMLPIVDIGAEIHIYCNIPEYATIFVETSNVTIYGEKIFGKIFSIYGTIKIENNGTQTIEEVRPRIHSLFGRVIMNDRVINQDRTVPSIFKINNHHIHSMVKYNATLTRVANIVMGCIRTEERTQIFEISRNSIFFSNNRHKNILDFKIELHNPDEELTTTIASIDLHTTPSTIVSEEYNDVIFDMLQLSITNETDLGSRLPIEFFLNGLSPKTAGIERKDNTLFIQMLNETTGLYVNVATQNGAMLSKYGITDIVIKNTINFVILILQDTNITVESSFCGIIFTNTGNITIAGPVTHNSKLISNFGSIYVGNISHKSNTLAIDNSHIASILGQVKVYGKVTKSNITTFTKSSMSIHDSISWCDKLIAGNTKTSLCRKT